MTPSPSLSTALPSMSSTPSPSASKCPWFWLFESPSPLTSGSELHAAASMLLARTKVSAVRGVIHLGEFDFIWFLFPGMFEKGPREREPMPSDESLTLRGRGGLIDGSVSSCLSNPTINPYAAPRSPQMRRILHHSVCLSLTAFHTSW